MNAPFENAGQQPPFRHDPTAEAVGEAVKQGVRHPPATPGPQAFLDTVFQNLPPDGRPWVAGFRCDPYHPDARWGGVPVDGRLPDIIEPGANNYLAVSSFKAGDDGRIHRRKANFAAMHLVMVDDVGTKVPVGSITLEPSYQLETSPGNFQCGYLLAEPVTDRALAEAVVEALVAQGLATDGKDPGMKGVTRYGRLPCGINNKPALVAEHGRPFAVRLVEWEPGRRYPITDVIGAYGLKLGKPRAASPEREPTTPPGDDPLLDWLGANGHIQGSANAEGWTPVSCPWVGEHTGGTDTGAAYLAPGGFKCHHGHCERRTIHDLRAWAKSQGWAKEQDAAIDPDDLGRCGIGPDPEPGEPPGPAKAAPETADRPDTASGKLRLCDMSRLRDAEMNSPQFVIYPLVPNNHVTLFGSHGGSGKTVVALTLSAHVACGRDWAGLKVTLGKVLFVSFEDDEGLCLWRLRNIALEYRLDFDAIVENLTVIDATEAQPMVSETNHYGVRRLVLNGDGKDLMGRINESRPDLVVIDNVSDAFDGDENNRRQVRVFVRGYLANSVKKHGGAVLLLAHIDKSAARYGAGKNSYSGSTGWHNSTRSRLALVDDELRQEKLNLGKAMPDGIRLSWTGIGVPVPAGSTGAASAQTVINNADDAALLACFAAAAEAGATVPAGDTGPATTWHALSVYPECPKPLRDNKLRFKQSLTRLLRAGNIRREEYRNAARKLKERLVLTGVELRQFAPVPNWRGTGADPRTLCASSKHRGVGIGAAHTEPEPGTGATPASPSVDALPDRIRHTLRVPGNGGMDEDDLVRTVCNGRKGATPALVRQVIGQMLLAGDIGVCNGRLVLVEVKP